MLSPLQRDYGGDSRHTAWGLAGKGVTAMKWLRFTAYTVGYILLIGGVIMLFAVLP